MSTAATPQVVVTLGTDHHPFNRLVSWVDHWAGDHPEVPCYIQHGTAPAPKHADGRPTMSVDDLQVLLAGARVVVGHAGPGTIQASLGIGRVPIIVARLAPLGEVVDDHQVPFGELMHATGRAILVDDELALHQALDAAMANPDRLTAHPSITAGADTVVRRIGDLIDGLLAR